MAKAVCTCRYFSTPENDFCCFASPGPTASFGNGFNLNGNASYIVRRFCASWLQIASVLDAPSIEYRILHI